IVIGDNINFEQSEWLLKQQGVEVIVINDKNCNHLMTDFIKANPKLWGEDIGLTEQQVLDK
ncbi:MAG: hypothetical protein RQ733_13905, partial [Methyloprofundus sp.]|nr:hypothetical protein [Methyloprofundus sp.]